MRFQVDPSQPYAVFTRAPANRGPVSKNFKLEEFFKGDDVGRISADLIEGLQLIRDAVGKPIRITSGYRNASRNAAVGGKSGSAHLHGLAADIQVDGMTPLELARVAAKVGFRRIGVAAAFVHVDVMTVQSGECDTWDYGQPNAPTERDIFGD